MQPHEKAQLQASLSAATGLLGAAKSMASAPTMAGTPVVALNPLIAAIEQLQKTIKLLVEKS